MKPRVAYLSPLPPARTGIADYSAELLPHLAEHLELELFVDEGERPTEAIREAFPLHSWRELARRHAERPYDGIVYHLGNNVDFHAHIYRALLATPGLVVLHEPMLHHLVRGMTLSRGDAAGYVEALRYAYGPTGEVAGRRFVDHNAPLDIWQFPLFEQAVDHALGLVVHNRFTRDRVLASRPATAVRVVPHHLSLEAGGARDAERLNALRASLGIPVDALVVGSYGFITPAKRLEVTLRAFARLRSSHPEAVLLLAGDVSPFYDLEAILSGELAAGVRHVGHLALDEFLATMELADIAVNLRYPTAGETSGTLIRLLGLGKPVIVTDAGAFAEIPDGCCLKVPLDGSEEEVLAVSLERLAADLGLRRRVGDNAARHLREEHSLAGSARGYVEALGACAGRPLPSPVVAPLRSPPPGDVRARLVASLAADACDLGVDERETELLAGLAATVTGLGIGTRGT